MKKNETDWFAVLAGNKVSSIDSKIRLQARLVRVALQKRTEEIDKEIDKDDDQFYQKFIGELIKEGYLEGYFKKEPTQIFKNKTKWLLALLMSGSFVAYAMKDGVHITDFQEVPNTTIEVSETFWGIVMDETGNRLTAFWPTQKKQIKKTRIKEITLTECSAEISTLKGCLKLKNKHQAQFNIGLMYEQGLNGVEKNSNIAYEWYKKSAAQGNQRARFNMEYLISKKLVK
jgi:TPR repeat protein